LVSTTRESRSRYIKGLVINAGGLVGVLDELMHGESGIVGLECQTYQHCSRRESFHQTCTSTTVSETLGLGTTEYVHIILSGYFSGLRNQKGAHTSTSTSTELVIWKPGNQYQRRTQLTQQVF
jgi:hypothetical protein